MSNGFYVKSFQPIAIHLHGVGPLQNEAATSIEFVDAEGQAANFFLLLSKNGRGKTTILECMTHLVGLLSQKGRQAGMPDWLRDYEDARMQLDVRIELPSIGRPILVSLIGGTVAEPRLKNWNPAELRQWGVEAQDWYVWGYGRFMSSEKWFGDGQEIMQQLVAYIDEASLRIPATGSELEQPTETAPTLLFFTAYRDLAKLAPPEQRVIARPDSWTHRLVRRIDREEAGWLNSVDQLLSWLYWLDGDGGRFRRAQDILNERVFKGTPKYLEGIRKDPPEAIVNNGGSRHRLDQLSSGEKSLVQLFLRIATHMTLNSILLIDEIEVHLHPTWVRAGVAALKELLRAHPGMMIIFTSHSHDVLERFDVKRAEEGLRKGGFLIDDI